MKMLDRREGGTGGMGSQQDSGANEPPSYGSSMGEDVPF